MPIEPDVGLAHMRDDGVLVIYSKSTALHRHHAMIHEGIGIPADKLVLANPPGVGSTFGYKLGLTNEALLGVACLATGRPVVLKYDYEQQQIYTGKRSPLHIKLKMAADKEGRLLAMEGDWTADKGSYADFGEHLVQRGAPAPGRRLRHPEHLRGRKGGLHEPLLGQPDEGLRFTPGGVRLRVLIDALAREGRHGSPRVQVQERLS